MAARVVTGGLDGKGLRIGLVASRFNEEICERLLQGALDCLERHGVAERDITVARVPGALELALVARRLAGSKRYDAIVCIGCVIRGETGHYDLVCHESARGIASVALETDLPITFGLLTVENAQQAIERAGSNGSNKGWDAARAAIEMASLLKALE